jgi:hypothetical protein
MARTALALALAALALSGCLPRRIAPADFAGATTSAEEAAPVGGAALHQRRELLARMYRDLVHLRESFDGIEQRGDREATAQLGRFAGAYIFLHLDPLLRPEWQSQHPELGALDASLRLAEVDVLLGMGEDGLARRVLDDVTRRFAGREDMLVDWPVGAQSPLGDAVKRLRAGKRGDAG